MTYMTMIARPPKILFFIYLLTGLEFQARFFSSTGFSFPGRSNTAPSRKDG